MSEKKINPCTYFPPVENCENLQMTPESAYSITSPYNGRKLCRAIIRRLGKHITITDANASVGGDTLQFSLHFDHVNAVEKNPQHMAMLKNNMEIFNRTNINYYEGSYLEFTDLKQDVIYFDPPWGGPEYKKKKNLRLKLDNEYIEDIVLRMRKSAKLIVLKLPINYDRQILYSTFSGIQIEEYTKKSGAILYIICFI